MATSRKPTAPATGAIDRFCGHFDDLFARLAERTAARHYLIGLLLPQERSKTLTELAALVPGVDRQRLHHFLHDAPWDSGALNARRLALWCAHPVLGPHANGVLIIDETGTASAAGASCWPPGSTSASPAIPPTGSWR
jgi:SRSO17 transposase